HDLAILITLGVTPSPDLIRQLGSERLLRGLESLWAKLEKMDWVTAAEALGKFLPTEALEQLTPEAWDDMRLSVGTHAERWIQSALDDGAASEQAIDQQDA